MFISSNKCRQRSKTLPCKVMKQTKSSVCDCFYRSQALIKVVCVISTSHYFLSDSYFF